MNYTFAMLKPDCFYNSHVGDVIGIFEKLRLNIWASKIMQLSRTHCAKVYHQHIDKPYYRAHEDYLLSGRVMAMVLMGDHNRVVDQVNVAVGATDPTKANPGTIRQMYGVGVPQNTIHSSDNTVLAYREMSIFFMPHEVPPGGPVPSDLPYDKIE